jgi:hypothetical protein
MTTLKTTLTIMAALLAGGTSLAMAQNGPATGGESPVAGGAAGGPAYFGGAAGGPAYFYHPRTGHRIYNLYHPRTGHRVYYRPHQNY